MKKIFTFILFLVTITNQAQKIGIQQLENATRLNSVEEKCNFFYSKGFVKESDSKNSKIVLVKKIFDKKLQEFDKEIITLENDTITYSLTSPKKYTNFKKAVDHYSYKEIVNQSETFYEKKYFVVKLSESEEINENSKTIHLFNFSIYKKEN